MLVGGFNLYHMEVIIMTEINTPNVRSSATDSDTSSSIVQRVLGYGERLPIDLPQSIDELKNWIIDQENHLARESARQGFGFLILKQELGEGEFARWLAEHDFREQRVYEHISVAKMLLAAPVKVQPLLMGLGKVKLIELARLPSDTIEEVAESGKLDELSRLSVRELKEQVRGLKAHNQIMTLDLEAAQRLNETLSNQKAEDWSQQDSDHSSSNFICTIALAEDWLERGLKELHLLQTELLTRLSSVQDASPSSTWETHACHMYTVTASLYSQLRTLLDQLVRELPESVQGGLVLVESRLSDKQIADIVQARQYQSRQAEREQHTVTLHINSPKKRGRPRKLRE
jgi:hypothetical protein